MDVMIQTDPCATHNAIVTDNIFRAPAFRQLIANEFHKQQLSINRLILKLMRFYAKIYLAKKLLLLVQVLIKLESFLIYRILNPVI